MTVLPTRWTMTACVVAGVVLSAGASCALRGTVERPGVEAGRAVYQPEEHNQALWQVASANCLLAGRTWSQGMQDGVLVGRCSSVESLGVASMPAPPRRRNLSVATTKPQERAPEERVGSGQVDMESAAQGGPGARTTAGARPVSRGDHR